MKVVIDISEKDYQTVVLRGQVPFAVLDVLRNGTPLPKGHGRLIDADYVINHICESKECYEENCKGKLYMRCMDILWVDDAPTIIERSVSE